MMGYAVALAFPLLVASGLSCAEPPQSPSAPFEEREAETRVFLRRVLRLAPSYLPVSQPLAAVAREAGDEPRDLLQDPLTVSVRLAGFSLDGGAAISAAAFEEAWREESARRNRVARELDRPERPLDFAVLLVAPVAAGEHVVAALATLSRLGVRRLVLVFDTATEMHPVPPDPLLAGRFRAALVAAGQTPFAAARTPAEWQAIPIGRRAQRWDWSLERARRLAADCPTLAELWAEAESIEPIPHADELARRLARAATACERAAPAWQALTLLYLARVPERPLYFHSVTLDPSAAGIRFPRRARWRDVADDVLAVVPARFWLRSNTRSVSGD